MAAMGRLYLNGAGTEQDLPEAVRLFRESAALGDSDGGYFLARCLSEGTGTGQDLGAAIAACEKALADEDFCDVKPAEARKLLKKLSAASAGNGSNE